MFGRCEAESRSFVGGPEAQASACGNARQNEQYGGQAAEEAIARVRHGTQLVRQRGLLPDSADRPAPSWTARPTESSRAQGHIRHLRRRQDGSARDASLSFCAELCALQP